jgi:hypothetical protein
MSTLTMDGAAGRGLLDAATSGGSPQRALFTDRQRRLDRLWRDFDATTYDGCAVDWDGRRNISLDDAEYAAATAVIPPGFVDPALKVLPLRFRKPRAPYYLVRMVVQRFTGLLFSETRHPQASLVGDEDSQEWLNAAITEGRFWQAMEQARDKGGAQGSVAVGYSFVDGKPVFEVHDARYCEPVFARRNSPELRALDIRYTYEADVRDPVSGRRKRRVFWYRRLIDEKRDSVWDRVPDPASRDPDAEPDWNAYQAESVEHGQGCCPVFWFANLPNGDEVDGRADCHGAYDDVRAIDHLTSRALTATDKNCAPTAWISSDEDIESVDLDEDQLLPLDSTGKVGLLEMNGKGIEMAWQAAEKLERRFLQRVRCVLDQSRSATERTATEVDRDYSAMWEQAGRLRGQYAPGIVALLNAMMDGARRLQNARSINPDTKRRVVTLFRLPPRVVKDPTTGKVKELVPQRLGKGGWLSLQWPPFTEPTVQDANMGTTAAGNAVANNFLDDEGAIRYVAPFFRVTDPEALVARMRQIVAEKQAQEQGGLMGKPPGEDNIPMDDVMDEPPGEGGEEPAGEGEPPPDEEMGEEGFR